MRYNIVYIHTHDSGKVLSPYGYNVPTEAIKAFAKEATMFREAYCVGPTCSPSRSGLLTGMYPHSNGMYGLSQRGFKLHDYHHHLVNFLNKHDYTTVLCGIQHEAGSYIDHKQGAKIIGYQENITTDPTHFDEEALVEWDYDNALKVKSWLQGDRGEEPFFLSFGLFATHRVFPKVGHADKEEIDAKYVLPPVPLADEQPIREDYAGYLKSATWADASFKVVIDTLKEQGLYDHTIIIFTTDHGIAFPFSKCTLFDSGISVSLMMRVPHSEMNGVSFDELVSQVDLFPTLCELLQLEKPAYLQGTSFADVFSKKQDKVREAVFSEINYHTAYEPARSIRTKRYKYIKYYDTSYLKVNRTNIDDSKSKAYYQDNDLEAVEKYEEALYDLLYDPGESRNVKDDPLYKEIVSDLRERLHNHQKETGDPILKGHFKVQPGWIVNKKENYHPSSKNRDDFLDLGE